MRQVVSLHVGRCGAGMGAAIWDGLTDEHGLDESGRFVGCSQLQLASICGHFDEVSSERYVPRAVFCDLDPNGLNFIKSWPIGKLFRPENFITSSMEASNNFAKGYNLSRTDAGSKTYNAIVDALRREFEVSDSVQAVHVTHSLGGGTGSGVTSLLLESIKENFGGSSICNFSLFPSPTSAEIVVESYNTVLAMKHLIEMTDVCFCFDNEALNNVSAKILHCERPGIVDANKMVAMTALGLTACTRFPGQLNVGINKLRTALVPLPRLHFLVTGLANLGTESFGHQQTERPVREMMNKMLSPNTMLTTCNYESGTAVTAAAVFRGRVSIHTLESAMLDVRNRKSRLFPSWLPHNVTLGACDIPPRGDSLSVTFAANHSSLMQLLDQQCNQVEKMFNSGRAFFHLYEEAGVNGDEMLEALSDTENLLNTYKSAIEEQQQVQKDGEDKSV